MVRKHLPVTWALAFGQMSHVSMLSPLTLEPTGGGNGWIEPSRGVRS
jgi:hypothetical protein